MHFTNADFSISSKSRFTNTNIRSKSILTTGVGVTDRDRGIALISVWIKIISYHFLTNIPLLGFWEKGVGQFPKKKIPVQQHARGAKCCPQAIGCEKIMRNLKIVRPLSPGQTESQVNVSWKLTCDFVWPGLACTCVDLWWFVLTLVEIKFAPKSKASFLPFGHPTHVNTSWVTIIS